MKDFLFGWLTKPKLEMTVLNEIGALVCLAMIFVTFIVISILLMVISDYIKNRRNKE